MKIGKNVFFYYIDIIPTHTELPVRLQINDEFLRLRGKCHLSLIAFNVLDIKKKSALLMVK